MTSVNQSQETATWDPAMTGPATIGARFTK